MKLSLLITTILCASFLVRGQSANDLAVKNHNQGVSFELNSNYDSALNYYKQAASYYLKADSVEAFLKEQVLIGYLHLENGQRVKAESLFKKTLDSFKSDIVRFELEPFFYIKLCLALSQQSKLFEAYSYALKAEATLRNKNPEWLHNDVYSSLANLTRYLGFYNESLKYCNHLLELDTDSLTTSHTYNTIGLIHKRLKNKETALYYYLKSLRIREKHGPAWVPYGMNNIANLYSLHENLDSALYWINNAIDISYQHFGRIWQLNHVLQLNKSEILIKLGSIEEAENALFEGYEILNAINSQRTIKVDYSAIITTALEMNALKLAKDILDEANPTSDIWPIVAKAEYFMNYIDYYTRLGKLDSALYYSDRALVLIESDSLARVTNEAPGSSRQVLHVQQIKISKIDILNQLYTKTGNENYLLLAQSQTDNLINNLTSVDFEHINLASASTFFNNRKQALNTLLKTEVLLYQTSSSRKHLENVQRIIESKRLNTFKKEFAYNHTKVAGLSDSVLLRRRNLQVQINEIRAKGIQTEELLRLQTELENIHLLIKEKNSNYYSTIFSTSQTLTKTETRLKPDETLVQFSFAGNVLYVLVSNNSETQLFTYDWTDENEQMVKDFVGILRDPNSKWAQRSERLLDKLQWEKLNISPGTVRIIADKSLTLVPFSLLMLDNEPLIKKYEFVYMNSLMEFGRSDQSNSNEVVSFAPFSSLTASVTTQRSEMREGFGRLPSSGQEVDRITDIWSGVSLKGQQASESAFKKLAPQSNIIHLATHSVVNNNNPLNSVIAFTENDSTEDGLLHTYELLEAELNASLVTLSACNTGVGKYYEGEGMISLATGFNIAGVDNIVMSLWPVPDQTTSIIMTSFYEHLKEGLSVPAALRKAKLDFISTQDANLRHPYYWAGFVLSTDQWNDQDSHTNLIWLMILIATIPIIVVLRKRQKANRS